MHAVGGVAGLKLKINHAGARSWVLCATVAGKIRDMGLGGFPDVTLAQARERARAARDKIHAGEDPIQARQAARSATAAASAKGTDLRTVRRRIPEGQIRRVEERQAPGAMEQHARPVRQGQGVCAARLPQHVPGLGS